MVEINVADLSDSELRKQLKDYGKTVGPITKSTRKVLEKQLEKFRSSNKAVRKLPKVTKASSTQKKNTKNLVPFSSDEEGEEVELKSSPVNSVTKSSATYKNTRRRSSNIVNNDSSVKFITQTSEIKNASTSPFLNEEPANATTRRRSVLTQSQKITNKKAVKYISGEFSDDDSVRKSTTNSFKALTLSPSIRKARPTPIDSHGFRTPEPYKPILSQKSPARAELDEKLKDDVDSSIQRMKDSFYSKKPSPIHHNQNGQHLDQDDGSPEEASDDEEEELDAQFITDDNSFIAILKNKLIWKFLLYLFLFILFAISLYCYSGDEQQNWIGIGTEKGTVTSKRDINAFLNCLYRDLSTKKGYIECGNEEVSDLILLDQLKSFCQTCFKEKKDCDTITTDGIQEVNSTYTKYFTFNGKAISATIASKSITCRIQQAVFTIFYRLFILLSLCGAVVATYYYVKKKYSAADEETRQVLHIVHKIVDTIKRHDTVCLTNKEIPPYLPIPHVRDMLIPFNKRKELNKTWLKAVDYLSASESRIRVETQRIAGEDFEVWRWIGVRTSNMKAKKTPTKTPPHLSTEQSKCWQGPAFDVVEKVVRLPIVTPSPCLKIRYIHEGPEEREVNWVKKVEDAVLEKCKEDDAQILHIYVDEESKEGCVYAKCDCLESASKAFRSMYGNWFDGRLVIVKFVTLTRYHQRFPDALKCSHPLKVSGKHPSALSWVQEN